MYLVRNERNSGLISGDFYPTHNNITFENFPTGCWAACYCLKATDGTIFLLYEFTYKTKPTLVCSKNFQKLFYTPNLTWGLVFTEKYLALACMSLEASRISRSMPSVLHAECRYRTQRPLCLTGHCLHAEGDLYCRDEGGLDRFPRGSAHRCSGCYHTLGSQLLLGNMGHPHHLCH